MTLSCLASTTQVLPCTPVSNRNPSEIDKYIALKPNHEVVERVPVMGGLTLEVCLCKWWASLGECTVDFEITFHGISATPPLAPPVQLQASPAAVHVHAPLRPETLSVSGKLTHLRKFYRPSKGGAELRALNKERDLLPLGRQIAELELSYSFEQSEKDAVKVLR